MTKPSDDARLPEGAERLLARWEHSDVHEVGAQRAGDGALQEILEGGVQPQPLAELDAAPFPREPDEASLPVSASMPTPPSAPSSPAVSSSPPMLSSPSMPSSPSRSSSGRPSNPGASRGRDDLRLLEESLALSTRARRQVALSAPPPSSVVGSAAPLRPSAAPPPRPSMPSATATPQPPVPMSSPASFAQPAPQPIDPTLGAMFQQSQRPRASIGGIVGGVVGVTGLAAAAAAWMVLGRPQTAPVATPTATSAPSALHAGTPPATAAPQTAAPAAKGEAAAAPSAPAAAEDQGAAVAQASRPAADKTDRGTTATAAAEPSPAPSKGVPSWLKSAAGGTQKSAAASAKESEGPSPGMKPADKGPSTDNLPTQPSHGAVQAAINAVMPRARSCVAGGKPVSAGITFRGSTGRVLSVSVSGAGVEKTVASCVRGALNGAKVSPFAKATFSSSTTVRP